jgi:PIN domain nuclease of toxin-antitoxin system
LTVVLLDTHVWVWASFDSARIAHEVREFIAGSDFVWVSAISFYEIGQKVRLGKWPDMALHVDNLADLLNDQGSHLIGVDGGIALRAALLDWQHRDPFDRLIAATAMRLDAQLISADVQFDDLQPDSAWRGRIW